MCDKRLLENSILYEKHDDVSSQTVESLEVSMNEMKKLIVGFLIDIIEAKIFETCVIRRPTFSVMKPFSSCL